MEGWMRTTMSQAALLDQIERERLVWEQLLRAVGEERMEQPSATGAWSFKDVVAHLNGWRVRTLARLDAARAGAEPAPPPWPAGLDEDSAAGLAQINAWIEQAGRQRSLREVLDEARRSFDLLRDAVLALSDEELADPSRYPWMGGEPVGTVIGYSFGHFHEEHELALSAWLDRIGRVA
ncbi:MAG: ClbS/DfsB family four-helix bundle protein [Oscillochloris sp.]|nr:ClbS/DfsB family four-helix bundle protein [Oscillochloris sp.]